jgi:hypothetical protein
MGLFEKQSRDSLPSLYGPTSGYLPYSTRGADTFAGMVSAGTDPTYFNPNGMAVVPYSTLRDRVQQELASANMVRRAMVAAGDPEGAARRYAQQIGALRQRLANIGISGAQAAQMFSSITGGTFDVAGSTYGSSGLIDEGQMPPQPAYQWQGPLQDFSGIPEWQGPHQPGPVGDQEPWQGPMQPQEPFVGPMQPPSTPRGWHPPMALPSEGGSSPGMRGAARRIAGSMFDRVMTHPGNTPAPAPALTPSPEPTPEKSAMMQWLEKYFARRI